MNHLRNGDPGFPAEGGQLEEYTVRLPDGTELAEIPDNLLEEIETRAWEVHENNHWDPMT